MNYIEQIKGFWIAQEVNQLGTSEIALYFYLLEVCNKSGWNGTFYRNNYKVMADLSIRSYKTLQSTRDKLKQKGIIDFFQKNGEANVSYLLPNLSKKYLGKGQGLGKGSGEGLGEGLGEENINQTETKPNQTNSKSHSRAEARVKEKKEVPFWKSFVETWNDFYFEKVGEKFNYLEKDFNHLKKIYNFLKKRAADKKFEFTEDNLLAAFKFFLKKAWEKDDWLKNNFSIANVLSQFNQITNGKQSNSKGAKSGVELERDVQAAFNRRFAEK